MVKAARIVGEMVSELARERTNSQPRYTAKILESDEEIAAGRRLAIDEFVTRGKIPKEEVDANGLLLDDPFLERSTFFGVYDQAQELEAVARLIWSPASTIDDMRMPTEKIDPAAAEFLLTAAPGSIAEFGSLAKRHGTPNVATLKLIRRIFRFAQDNDIKTIVCGLEPKLFPAYKQMFGGALKRLHESTIEFPGIHGDQVSLMIDVDASLSYDPSKMYAGALGHVAVGTLIRYFMRNSPAEEGLQKIKA